MSTITIEAIEPAQASRVCRAITETLPEWFGIPEANARYEAGCLERTSFVAREDGQDVGLIVLEFPFPSNCNIYWMGVRRDFHGKNIGMQLFQKSEEYCRKQGCTSMTVETLSQKEKDENYFKTYRFYEKAGFKPLFELNTYGPEFAMVYMGKFLK